jgi:hypothetical protein
MREARCWRRVVPDGHSGPAQGEDSSGVVLELDGADGLDAGEAVGEDSSAGSGEEVQRVKGTVHGIARVVRF